MQTTPPVLERHGRDIYRWAYRVLGHHEDALDVVQDVFVRWMTRMPADTESERAWLRRVTVNCAIDVYRSRRRLPDAGAEAGEAPLDPDDHRALRSDIADALDSLSDMQRSVLIAKVHDGLTFACIAAEHDLAVPTVKTHYIRALAAVRTKLQRRWG